MSTTFDTSLLQQLQQTINNALNNYDYALRTFGADSPQAASALQNYGSAQAAVQQFNAPPVSATSVFKGNPYGINDQNVDIFSMQNQTPNIYGASPSQTTIENFTKLVNLIKSPETVPAPAPIPTMVQEPPKNLATNQPVGIAALKAEDAFTGAPTGGLSATGSATGTAAIDNSLIESVKRIYAEDQSLGDLSPYFVNANQATRNEAIRQGLYNLNTGADYSIIDQARAAKKINPAADTSAFFAKANEATKNAAGQQNLYTWTPTEISEFKKRGDKFLESGVEFVDESGRTIQVAPADRATYLANSSYVGQGPGGVQVRAVALRRSPSSQNPQLVFNPFANQSAALNIDLTNQAMDLNRVDGGTPRYYGMNTVDHGYTLSPYGSRVIGLDPIASSVLGSRGYIQADQPALKPK